MLCVCPVKLSWALAVLVISVYQYALSARGLGNYILHGSDGKGSRLNPLDANREGLLSCLGYVSLYLVGVQIGSLLFSKQMQTFKDWVKKFWILLAVSTAGYVCQSLSSHYIQPTSRRMANLPFVFWIVGLSAQVLWSCLAVDLISTAVTALVVADRNKTDIPLSERQMLSSPKMKSAIPCLLQAVNTNGLFFFLMSNVLTGLINMCMHTHHASVSVAVCILLIYTFSLCTVIVYMDKRKIVTKIW